MDDIEGRRLIVMRHAKAESLTDRDHARALTDRGRADSRTAGRWLSDNNLIPDFIVVSAATRAVETADEVCGGLGTVPETRADEELYEAEAGEVLEFCRAAIPEVARCVLVVAHNPTMDDVAGLLQLGTDGREVHFSTAGLAVFHVAVEWPELDAGTGLLLQTHTPNR